MTRIAQKKTDKRVERKEGESEKTKSSSSLGKTHFRRSHWATLAEFLKTWPMKSIANSLQQARTRFSLIPNSSKITDEREREKRKGGRARKKKTSSSILYSYCGL